MHIKIILIYCTCDDFLSAFGLKPNLPPKSYRKLNETTDLTHLTSRQGRNPWLWLQLTPSQLFNSAYARI